MTDRAFTDLDPKMQVMCQKFLDGCKAAGVAAFITQTWRSPAEQTADFAQGRTAPGHIITNARAGESPHNCTLPDGTPASRAFDFAIRGPYGVLDWDSSDEQWQTAIKIGESLGLVSGAAWHIQDDAHMELNCWKTA